MAIKVLIERKVKAGYESLVWEMLRDLRGQAVRQKGYLYGETWRSLDDPRIFLVSSTWGSRDYWESWFDDDFRRNIDLRLSAFLRRPRIIKIYEELATLPTPGAGAQKRARRGSRR